MQSAIRQHERESKGIKIKCSCKGLLGVFSRFHRDFMVFCTGIQYCIAPHEGRDLPFLRAQFPINGKCSSSLFKFIIFSHK